MAAKWPNARLSAGESVAGIDHGRSVINETVAWRPTVWQRTERRIDPRYAALQSSTNDGGDWRGTRHCGFLAIIDPNQPRLTQEKIMETKKTVAEQHTSAAKHHESAAKHHREAAKALDAGKPEQAATHAEVANGHLAHATDTATDISKTQATKSDGTAKAA